MIHIKDGDVEYLQFRRLLEFQNIKHCYSMRPLDFKIGEKKKVINDYESLCASLGLDYKNIYRPNQTHSNNIARVENEPSWIVSEGFQNIDGLITKNKDKILSLCFADCIPLYFYDPVKNVIGMVHSGWKGTYNQIARDAIRSLKEEFGILPEDLICRDWSFY